MPVFLLSDEPVFPPSHLASKEGLLAIGGDLSHERLLAAYRQGIFPWYSEGDPILWWSPNPRMVLYPHEFKLSRSFKKAIHRGIYQVSFDTAFDQVIHTCAQIRLENGEGTWISSEMIAAYTRLYALGYAHSVEAWHTGRLVGGLYGVAMGRIFFGESMFSTMSDASKICLYHLVTFLSENQFLLIDCQVPTAHLMRLGARNIPRDTFLVELKEALQHPSLNGPWRL